MSDIKLLNINNNNILIGTYYSNINVIKEIDNYYVKSADMIFKLIEKYNNKQWYINISNNKSINDNNDLLSVLNKNNIKYKVTYYNKDKLELISNYNLLNFKNESLIIFDLSNFKTTYNILINNKVVNKIYCTNDNDHLSNKYKFNINEELLFDTKIYNSVLTSNSSLDLIYESYKSNDYLAKIIINEYLEHVIMSILDCIGILKLNNIILNIKSTKYNNEVLDMIYESLYKRRNFNMSIFHRISKKTILYGMIDYE